LNKIEISKIFKQYKISQEIRNSKDCLTIVVQSTTSPVLGQITGPSFPFCIIRGVLGFRVLDGNCWSVVYLMTLRDLQRCGQTGAEASEDSQECVALLSSKFRRMVAKIGGRRTWRGHCPRGKEIQPLRISCYLLLLDVKNSVCFPNPG
jgi:hypothetical protein